MLIAPARIARYWACGGDIYTLGGPLPLAAGGRASPGCRVLSRRRLVELRDWHAAERAGADVETARYHQLCLRDADHALAAFRPALLVP